MTAYVAFLRAINVGGRAIIKMTDLRDAFAAAGCTGVRTYIQSGNVVFESSKKSPRAIVRDVQGALLDLIGSEPGIYCRTVREVEGLVKASPFKRWAAEKDAKLYVAFLSGKPKTTPPLPLRDPKEALEVVGIRNLEAFIVSRRKTNGFYGFPNNLIEKELGVSATTRNWSTITKIAAFVQAHPAE